MRLDVAILIEENQPLEAILDRGSDHLVQTSGDSGVMGRLDDAESITTLEDCQSIEIDRLTGWAVDIDIDAFRAAGENT